jgi:hypothetical protein
MKRITALALIFAAGLASAQIVRLEGPPRISSANLVAHWRFSEGSGTSVADFSGNGNTGTFDGTWTRGKYGNAGNFVAASTQEVNVGNKASLNMGTSDFSVAIWAKTSTAAASILVGKYGTIGYFLGLDAAGKFYGKVRDASTNVSVLGSVISDGSWHLLVMTVDRSDAATGLTLYLDGEFNTYGQQGGGNIDNSDIFYIGRLASGYYITAEIDDVRIWKRLIGIEEIKRLWSQSSAKCFIDNQSPEGALAF